MAAGKALAKSFQRLNLAGPCRQGSCLAVTELNGRVPSRQDRKPCRHPRRNDGAVISGLLVFVFRVVICEFTQGFSLFPWEEQLSGALLPWYYSDLETFPGQGLARSQELSRVPRLRVECEPADVTTQRTVTSVTLQTCGRRASPLHVTAQCPADASS